MEILCIIVSLLTLLILIILSVILFVYNRIGTVYNQIVEMFGIFCCFCLIVSVPLQQSVKYTNNVWIKNDFKIYTCALNSSVSFDSINCYNIDTNDLDIYDLQTENLSLDLKVSLLTAPIFIVLLAIFGVIVPRFAAFGSVCMQTRELKNTDRNFGAKKKKNGTNCRKDENEEQKGDHSNPNTNANIIYDHSQFSKTQKSKSLKTRLNKFNQENDEKLLFILIFISLFFQLFWINEWQIMNNKNECNRNKSSLKNGMENIEFEYLFIGFWIFTISGVFYLLLWCLTYQMKRNSNRNRIKNENYSNIETLSPEIAMNLIGKKNSNNGKKNNSPNGRQKDPLFSSTATFSANMKSNDVVNSQIDGKHGLRLATLFGAFFGNICIIVGYFVIIFGYDDYKSNLNVCFSKKCNYSVMANSKLYYIEHVLIAVIVIFIIVFECIISITKKYKAKKQIWYVYYCLTHLLDSWQERSVIMSLILSYHVIPMAAICINSYNEAGLTILLLFLLGFVLLVHVIAVLTVSLNPKNDMATIPNLYEKFFSIFSIVWIISILFLIFYEYNDIYRNENGLYIEMVAICWFVWMINIDTITNNNNTNNNNNNNNNRSSFVTMNDIFDRIYLFCIILSILLTIIPFYDFVIGITQENSHYSWEYTVSNLFLCMCGIIFCVACVRSVTYKQNAEFSDV